MHRQDGPRMRWTWIDYLVAGLLALIVVGMCGVMINLILAEAGEAQTRAVLAEAQARIDASLPARERPVAVSVAPAVVAPVVEDEAKAEEEPETPAWYIAGIPLEPELQKALWEACQEFGVDYSLALAVIEQETNFQNLYGDGGGSVGYFQIQPRWWSGLMEEIGVDDLTDPVDNFRTGCAVLAQLIEQYDGSVTDALTAYNSGRPGQSVYADAALYLAAKWLREEAGQHDQCNQNPAHE